MSETNYRSDGYDPKITRGYDHVHWTIYGSEPIDSEMGTTSGDIGNLKGKIALVGRASDGYHHTLLGPITVRQYKALRNKKNF